MKQFFSACKAKYIGMLCSVHLLVFINVLLTHLRINQGIAFLKSPPDCSLNSSNGKVTLLFKFSVIILLWAVTHVKVTHMFLSLYYKITVCLKGIYCMSEYGTCMY
jgi:hypothetical protein